MNCAATTEDINKTDYDFNTLTHVTSIFDGATSSASAITSSLAALIKSENPALTNVEIRDIILNTTDNIDAVNPSYVGLLGTGRINAYRALSAALPPDVPQNFAIQSVVDPFNSSIQHPKLTWTVGSEPDLTGYRIERKINSGAWSVVASPSATSNNWTDYSISRQKSSSYDNAYYRIRAIDYAETYSGYTAVKSYWYAGGGIAMKNGSDDWQSSGEGLPTAFALYQNFPNPFNPVTNIAFDLAGPSVVKLNIYDISGNLVTSLINGRRDPGRYRVAFNASGLASGIYIYKLVTQDYTMQKRMLLMK